LRPAIRKEIEKTLLEACERWLEDISELESQSQSQSPSTVVGEHPRLDLDFSVRTENNLPPTIEEEHSESSQTSPLSPTTAKASPTSPMELISDEAAEIMKGWGSSEAAPESPPTPQKTHDSIFRLHNSITRSLEDLHERLDQRMLGMFLSLSDLRQDYNVFAGASNWTKT
jgi:hypothetical protein